ncbi:hypothetical protein L596_008861 [Steinernema carpocapsae]|uniref:DNA-directed RNA polymerases I, II, and III subunit RPABC1 n=1 Tax=Steinernema carpocapsae TaxID=34508 RepID=A0A4U5PE10_STECR|nr:hypothetical protein L596_008861 [Steinernema carpocapsae]
MSERGAKMNITDDSVQTWRLWRIRKTLTQMCHDRDFIIAQEELDMTLEEFGEKFGKEPSVGNPSRNSLTLLVAHRTDNESMFVCFPEEPKIGIKSLKAIFLMMKEQSCTRAIIVLQQGMTPAAKTALDEIKANDFRIEYFIENELLINITEHELVPEHVVMSASEKKELLQRYKLKESQLPRIQAGDPVARYYGLQRGQVVKIIRPSKTAGRYITYRFVV